MISKFIPVVIFTLLFGAASAQFGGRGGAGGGGGAMPNGRFYGKIVDSKTNKPVDAASVQLVTSKFDRVKMARKDTVISGQLTAANGDFSLENVPVMGDYRLKITAIGFKTIEQKVSFLTPDQQQKVMQMFMSMNAPKTDSSKKQQAPPNMMDQLKKIFGGDLTQMASMADKDLGNIKMVIEAEQLGNVTVVGNRNAFTMGIDRKIFDATKAIGTSGQTALEVMKQVPSLNVDIDGNVTLRNATPTIYVDGLPTTLTLDQIPADAIQNVEVITNPSAKYDASGGTASILNIVMKKNRKSGYNGSVRGGIDQRGKYNIGGDFNLRQQKVNIFLSGTYNQRKSVSDSKVDNRYFKTSTTDSVYIGQNIENTSDGYFAFFRGGFDYLMDNRNTITIAGNIVKGNFGSDQNNHQFNDTFSTPMKIVPSIVSTNGDGVFHNNGGTVSYKHNFAKTGHELTANINYNHTNSTNNGTISNLIYNSTGSVILPHPIYQLSDATSSSNLMIAQADYANPLSKDSKIEAGVRTQIRDFNSSNTNYFSSYATTPFTYVTTDLLNSNYKFTDQVYAAYGVYTGKTGNLGYNFGLRAESSNYKGTKVNKIDSTFSVKYPISLFPSAFLSYKLDDKQDIQFNYTRRINRPNFQQLIPFINYSDQFNLTSGNPGLKPEFTNSFEANYSYQIDNNNSILVSTYYKHTTDLITRFYDTITNPVYHTVANLITYVNANSSTSYGLELTSRNNITNHWDVTTNLNFYNSSINSANVDSISNNSKFSFFGKINTNYRFGKGSSWTILLSGDFQGKTILPVNNGGGGGNGGGRGGGGGSFFMGGGNQNAGTNGYVNQSWGMDASLKKEFLKNKAASITLSVNDIFKTKIRDTYTFTNLYNQEYNSRRDQQIFRLQLSYRFGKQDVSLFKRKNLKGEMEGMQDATGGTQQ